MTRRCSYCGRFTGDTHLCAGLVEDAWSWNWADEWDRQMAEYGWAVLPDDWDDAETVRVVSIIAEQRWHPAGKRETPSRLWDGAHVGYRAWAAA